MKNGLVLLVLGGLLVGVLVGCSAPLGAAFPEGTAGAVAAAKPALSPGGETVLVRTSTQAPVLERSTVTQWVSDPCAPPAPPAPCYTACGPRCWSGCGLPCAEGFQDVHLRGVIGYAFHAGTESGDGNLYMGADVGWTSKCCWGIDAFYRVHCGSFDREIQVPGAARFLGEDGGHFNHVGIKATYQRSFGSSRWYGYAGAGPQYFWTDGYLDEDTGIGGFGELGVGYVLKKNWRIRAAVEVLGQSTSAGRLSPADDGEDRLLWFIAPVVQVELAL